MKRILIVPMLVLVILMAFPVTAFAGGMLDGRVIVGGDFTLQSGETLDGDLLVLGGSATLEEESRVRGDVIVLGGNVIADGIIEGDVAVVGGNFSLRSNAVVQGDVQSIGGSISRAEGSRVEGHTFTENDFEIPFNFDFSQRIFTPIRITRTSLAVRSLWFMFRSFMLAAIAVLVVMFWPKSTKRVAKASIGQPLIAGGLGLLTFVLAPAVLIVLMITILLIPVAFLAVGVLILAVLYGWIAIGLEVGERLGEMFKWNLHPAAAAGLGTFLFSIVIGGIGFIDCLGFLVIMAVCSIALGGVVLSRFGTREYAFSPVEVAAEELPAPEAKKAPSKEKASKKEKTPKKSQK